MLEVRNATSINGLQVRAGAVDLTARFGAPKPAQLDCDSSPDLVVRADLQSFELAGNVRLTATVSAGGTQVSDNRDIEVRSFNMPFDSPRRNVILFIGDAMGTAYRDAARLVSRSIVDSSGKNYVPRGLLRIASGDGQNACQRHGHDVWHRLDCARSRRIPAPRGQPVTRAFSMRSTRSLTERIAGGDSTVRQMPRILQYITDNPRIETLWQYLKRRFQYRTGIVTTADVTDATPAVQGANVGYRQARFEIARQYRFEPIARESTGVRRDPGWRKGSVYGQRSV